MKVSTSVVFTALAIGIAAPVASADQSPRISINARALRADGGADAATRSPHLMVIGHGVTSYLFASDSLCGLGRAEFTAPNLETMLRQKMHVWRVTRTGVSHANGQLTFDLDWSRFDNGSSMPAASGKQRLTLAEGATYPIDLVRAKTPTSCGTAAVMLEVHADAIEAPEFADTMLTYDLWLTHQDGTGKKQTHHFVISGKHGAQMPFEFTPIRFDMPQLVPNQYDIDLVTRVLGKIRGRLDDQRNVSVELETRRTDRLERTNVQMVMPPTASGRKTLELKLGETVEIELPRQGGFVSQMASPDAKGFSGRLGASPGTAPAAPAVSLSKDGYLVVSFKEFFADDRFSVMVRVRKAE